MEVGKKFQSWSGRLGNMRRSVNVQILLNFLLPSNCLPLIPGLHLTAQGEYRIATYEPDRPSPSSSNGPTDLSRIATSLGAAAADEKSYPEDAFQARICLAWLYWTLNEPTTALQQLPVSLPQDYKNLSPSGANVMSWTYVCLVKGAYLKGQKIMLSIEIA